MAYYPDVGGSISATSTNTNTDLKGVKNLLIVNDGTNSVFLRLSQMPAPFHTVATTSDFELKSGEAVSPSASDGKTFMRLSTICNAAETATVRFIGTF